MNDGTGLTRRDFVAGGAAAMAWTRIGPSAFGGTDGDPRLAEAKRWFKAAQYGMMVHWGLYSLLAGEYRGKRMDSRYIGEWIQQYYRIPNTEYARLAKAFNPLYFDADEWVGLARDAGMKYLVFTAKHHDGFAMYRSKVSKYNVVDATPFGRDVVGELAEACRRHGLKLGLYYSQELDWNEPDGGGDALGKTWSGGAAYWTNNWDFPDASKKVFSRCYERKIRPQVEEILTQYGDLCLVWFDIGLHMPKALCRDLYDLVRSRQPACLINSRLGCGICDYTSAGDNEIPDDDKSGMLFETPATLNDTWGYKAHDQNWKSAAEVRRIREHLKARGANYLLNVGPDHLGRIPAPSADILRAAKRNIDEPVFAKLKG